MSVIEWMKNRFLWENNYSCLDVVWRVLFGWQSLCLRYKLKILLFQPSEIIIVGVAKMGTGVLQPFWSYLILINVFCFSQFPWQLQLTSVFFITLTTPAVVPRLMCSTHLLSRCTVPAFTPAAWRQWYVVVGLCCLENFTVEVLKSN